MTYTTGSASDQNALKTALVNACTSDGWTETTDGSGDTVIYKNGIYIRVKATTSSSGSFTKNQLNLLGRTGTDSGDAPDVVTIGDWESEFQGTINKNQIFPVNYHIFTFSNEAFMVVHDGSGEYQWCAFGQSQQSGIPGTGNWIGATFGNGTLTNYENPIIMSSNFGGNNFNEGNTSGALFWLTRSDSENSINVTANCWFHNNFETSYPWSFGNGGNYTNDVIGIKYLTELIDTQPNTFNSESIFMPIKAYKTRDSSKVSQLVEINNVYHIRIDNYDDEQVVSVGGNNYMIFPWFKRNMTKRDGSNDQYDSIEHTGTFGWAIKKA